MTSEWKGTGSAGRPNPPQAARGTPAQALMSAASSRKAARLANRAILLAKSDFCIFMPPKQTRPAKDTPLA